MKVNKHIAQSLLITNGLYLAFGVWKFIHFHETFFKDFTRKVPRLAQQDYLLLQVVPLLFTIILYVGFFWLIIVFNEKKWIWSGILSFFICKVYSIVAVFMGEVIGTGYMEMMTFIHIFTWVTLLYMLVTFMFVANKALRPYFWLFAVLWAFAETWNHFGPALYDDYGERWMLVNRDIVYYIPFIITVPMYLDIIKKAPQINLASKSELDIDD